MSRVSDLLRKTLGSDQIIERLERIERSDRTHQILQRLDRIEHPDRERPHIEPTQSNGSGLEILPGTPYSRYAIPVEYPPSRAFGQDGDILAKRH